MKKRPKIGLAIGGGAAYGLSAIGVLRVLEEYKIPIDIISGTSIGAVIGALYASGMRSFSLEDEVLSTQWRELLDFILPEKGLVSGKKVEEHIRELINNKTFEELDIPLLITAVDIVEGKEVVFYKGDVATAVRASISIPGVFTPVEMDDLILVDGGVLDPIPTGILKKRCNTLIALDFMRKTKPVAYASSEKENSELLEGIKQDFIETELKCIEDHLKRGKINLPRSFRWFVSPKSLYKNVKKKPLSLSSLKILEVTKQSHNLMMNEVAELKLLLNPPSIRIKPDLSKMEWLDFDKGEYAIKQGEAAARAQINKIIKAVKKR
ncbi:patatin-like phospholipase family protein [Candidatus Woesearchaeota archaeon]|nr:patatin-like phospholipase family protein [Candidatus Woesearchaeota archaeon]